MRSALTNREREKERSRKRQHENLESVSLRLKREFQGNRQFLFRNCCLTSALKGTEDNACGNTQASTLSQEVIQESWTL